MKKTIITVALSLVSAFILQASEVPEEADIKSMTESSLLSFGRAVKKKDFSTFYDGVATVWQKQTTPEKLEEAFKDFYGKNVDLPAAIKEMDPVFNHKPEINSDDVLIVKGYYPTTPNRIVFELKYLEEEGDWKLVGINVNLKE
jgi:hypothetical protein